MDCFCAAVPDPVTSDLFAEQIAGYLNQSPSVAQLYCHEYRPEVDTSGMYIRVGIRGKVAKQPCAALASLAAARGARAATFSFTRQSCVLLERVAVAVTNKEPVLIVGETGTGEFRALLQC